MALLLLCRPRIGHSFVGMAARETFADAAILGCSSFAGSIANLHSVGYNTKGVRLVAGVVPLSPDLEYVLMIQSTRRKGWVLPKGGWESDETCEEAATREAWEEAGVTVNIGLDLGIIEEQRALKMSKNQSEYHFFQGIVQSQHEEWPERHKRERHWFTFRQAWEELKTRPELQEALDRSSIKRN